MTPEEAEAVLKVAGWSFVQRPTKDINGQVIRERWYCVHEADPKNIRSYMVGFDTKSKAIKVAWKEYFREKLVLS